MSKDWTIAFTGSIAEANMVQAELEAAGIPAFMPDANMRTMDPFLLGGGDFLDATVCVPRSAAERAQEVIAEATTKTRTPADFAFEGDPGEAAVEPDEIAPNEADAALASRVRKLAQRIRFGSISIIGVPFALAALPEYFRGVRAIGQRPPGHGLTLAAGVFALAQVAVLALMIWSAANP